MPVRGGAAAGDDCLAADSLKRCCSAAGGIKSACMNEIRHWFANPWIFTLLSVLPLLGVGGFLAARRRRRILAHFGSRLALRPLVARRRWLRVVQLRLLAFGMMLLVAGMPGSLGSRLGSAGSPGAGYCPRARHEPEHARPGRVAKPLWPGQKGTRRPQSRRAKTWRAPAGTSRLCRPCTPRLSAHA